MVLSDLSFNPTPTLVLCRRPQVLVTPTTDIGKILGGLHTTHISEEADLATSLQVAQLALKHRQNKNQRQRIIAFVGSPLKPKADEKGLVKLAKKLKKNNVAVDIVSFGDDEMEENDEEEVEVDKEEGAYGLEPGSTPGGMDIFLRYNSEYLGGILSISLSPAPVEGAILPHSRLPPKVLPLPIVGLE